MYSPFVDVGASAGHCEQMTTWLKRPEKNLITGRKLSMEVNYLLGSDA